MKFWRVGLGLIVVGLAVVSLSRANVRAQTTDTSFNIVTSPLPIGLSGNPGSTLTTDIRVQNNSQHAEKLKVSLMKFSAYGEEGKPAIQDRGSGDDYFDWVSFSPSIFDAPPQQWQTVKMSIALPKTAAFGYYYAVVFSRASNPTPTGKENVLVGSTAVLVLVEAKVPGAKRSAQIVSFTADHRFYEFLPANFSIKLHNDGNIHLVPHGNIFINRGKKQVASLEFNAQQGNILPGTNRIFTVSWNDGFPVYQLKESGGQTVLDKHDKPIYSLHWDLGHIQRLKFGHYTAHLVAAYDNGTQDVPLEATVSFWVIPWRLILILIAIPVVPAVLMYALMKWRIKRKYGKAFHEKK